MKVCPRCKNKLKHTEFFSYSLKKDARKAVYLGSECKICCGKRKRINDLKRKYGLTVEDYDNLLLSQNGVCAICKRPPGKRRLAVDHNHITNKNRGLLCYICNKFIVGVLEKYKVDPQCVVEYFKKYGE